MKRLFLTSLLLMAIHSFAQTTKLRLASDVWPPFTNIEKEKSIATDLVNEVLSRQNIQSSTEMVNFNDLLEGIDSGKYNGSAALWISDERSEKYLFSEPYLYNQLILVGRTGSDVSAVSFSDLSGKRIGIIDNYDYGDFNTSEEIIIVPGESNQKNLEKLLSGEIDYMLVDALIIQYILKYQINDVTEYLEIGNTPLLIKSLHFVLNKDIPDGDQIISLFNEEIERMIIDGTYHRILELNWIKIDIDGDGKLELVLEGEQAGIKAPQNIYGLMMDTSYKEHADGPKRYYIDGKLYEDWDNIPKSYKLDLITDTTPSMDDVIIKLAF